ncbi:hypothetical protein H6P81_009599 [Aristolochia fimbriata]|uniref:Uncharacterized protein n=1 Tax=Aristolochia fimbriata TaxID=158543 RepID=A0AAV7EMK2_ARIFI|nr:hypothetical protein H6P81_009599 [Aristolochia fimbriata]
MWKITQQVQKHHLKIFTVGSPELLGGLTTVVSCGRSWQRLKDIGFKERHIEAVRNTPFGHFFNLQDDHVKATFVTNWLVIIIQHDGHQEIEIQEETEGGASHQTEVSDEPRVQPPFGQPLTKVPRVVTEDIDEQTLIPAKRISKLSTRFKPEFVKIYTRRRRTRTKIRGYADVATADLGKDLSVSSLTLICITKFGYATAEIVLQFWEVLTVLR